MKKNYDFVIAGGGTAGCAAAFIAGKYGKSVLLVEKSSQLGGAMTSGLVIPGMHTSDNQINTEFFSALVKKLNSMGGQVTYQSNPAWFNPQLNKIALDSLLSDVNVDILFNSKITELIGSNAPNLIKKVKIVSEMLSVCIGATNIIDATGNCELGILTNSEFQKDEQNFQPISLRFEMSGIDMKTFSKWLLETDSDRNVTSSEIVDGQIHLSTAYTWDKGKKWALSPLFDDAVSKGVLKDTDRNYFQIFTIPNMPSSISFNCPRLLSNTEINPLDVEASSKALIDGRSAILRISKFCQKYFKGFKNAYISNIANQLGIRVSRRIVGRYVYTVDDLRSGRKFKNPVVISDYPIDVHSNKKDASVLEMTKQEYQLPIEALMSKNIDNFFVIGRCLSADFYAQGALRIQPSCFSMGEGLIKGIINGTVQSILSSENIVV